MVFKTRIKKLEATLEAREKFFLWLARAKAAGGFMAYWQEQLKGRLVPFDWFAKDEAFFLWYLVNNTNFAILRNAEANRNLRSFAHVAIDATMRQIAKPNACGVFVAVRPFPELAECRQVFVC